MKESSRTLQRFDPLILEDALKYLLSGDNVVPLSWGTKKVRLSPSESVTLPCLLPRRSVLDIYADYSSFCTQHDFGMLGRTSFYRIFAACTSGKQRLLTAVDYVTGVLINDPTAQLQRIIDELSPIEERERLSVHLELVRNFLKNECDQHVLRDDNV